MCYDKTDYRIIRYPEKKKMKISEVRWEDFLCVEETEK